MSFLRTAMILETNFRLVLVQTKVCVLIEDNAENK